MLSIYKREKFQHTYFIKDPSANYEEICTFNRNQECNSAVKYIQRQLYTHTTYRGKIVAIGLNAHYRFFIECKDI